MSIQGMRTRSHPQKKKKSGPQKSYIPEVKMDFFSEKSDLPTFWK